MAALLITLSLPLFLVKPFNFLILAILVFWLGCRQYNEDKVWVKRSDDQQVWSPYILSRITYKDRIEFRLRGEEDEGKEIGMTLFTNPGEEYLRYNSRFLLDTTRSPVKVGEHTYQLFRSTSKGCDFHPIVLISEQAGPLYMTHCLEPKIVVVRDTTLEIINP